MPKEIDVINETIKHEKEKGTISTKEINGGYHTFGELYNHRNSLFCVICNSYPEISFKSKKHFDEENDPMFNGDFIAGINTPLGVASYHIKLQYWDDFHIQEIERAPEYDGHDSNDDIMRILSLTNNHNKILTK